MVDYSPALMTDMYEYTMLDAALKDGTADRKCVFEVAIGFRGGYYFIWNG